MTMLSPFLRKALFLVLVSMSSVFAASKPLLWNVPAQASQFWGRKVYLIELQQKLTEGPVVVTGLSGVGKSQLTFAFARQNASKYRIVWVFDALKELDEQMIAFANKLYALENKGKFGSFSKKEEASHYVKTLLRTCAFSWLLIFDGAANAATVKDASPETHGAKNKHVLVSSLSDRDARGVIRLEALSNAEAHTFLKHYLKDASAEDITKLARLLENHPLALLQAASYINATPGMGVEAYITFFSKNKADYFASEAKALQGQPLLSTAIRMSIDKLKAASPSDYTVLVALSMLNTAKIEGSLIEKAYMRLTQGDMGGFRKIQDVALISSLGDKTYKIHDYVRDVILMSADKETVTQAANLNAQVFLALFPEKVEDCVAVFEKNPGLVSHIKQLMTHMDEMDPETAFSLGVRQFYYVYYIARNYDEAKNLSRVLSRFLSNESVKDPLLRATFLNANSFMTFREKGVDAAVRESLQAKDLLMTLNIETVRHEMIMLLANNLSSYYYWQGNITEAEKCIDETEILSKGQPYTPAVSSIDFLRFLFKTDRGDFNGAKKHLTPLFALEKKDDVFKKVSGHYLKSLKACSLLKMGDAKQAKDVSLDAYKHAVASSNGQKDTDVVGRVLIYLSLAQSATGEAKVAETSAKRAIAIFDRELLGTHKNRRQALSHMALADAYMGQKRYQDAVKEYIYAEDIYNKTCTHFAFDDMSELYHKMVIAYIALNDQLNARRYALKHMNTFPIDHPRFVDIYYRECNAGYKKPRNGAA